MLEKAKRTLLELSRDGGERMLAAVSGGEDSMCLLHLLTDWGRLHGLRVTAAHFNHHLRGESADRDASFVRDWCAGHGVPFLLGEGDTRALARDQGLSEEEAARKLRYAFLQKAAAEAGCRWILTAHHADDNAETMLLNLIRGTGSAGLAGIPRVRDNIARPFRDVSRAELAEYAAAHDLPHVEDETNGSDDAARNLLRHRVLPVLREINPRAVENMARAAEILEAENDVLREAAGALAARARPVPEGLRIGWSELEAEKPVLRSRAVLELMAAVCGRRKDLTAAHAAAALDLIRGPEGRAVLALPYGLRARSGGGALWIQRLPPPPEDVPVAAGTSVRFGSWTVALTETPETGYAYPLRRSGLGDLRVTAWHRGDRLTLPGSRGARTLKRLWADAGISPGERDAMPVLRSGERPAAAPGVGAEEDFVPGSGDETLFVTFKKD